MVRNVVVFICVEFGGWDVWEGGVLLLFVLGWLLFVIFWEGDWEKCGIGGDGGICCGNEGSIKVVLVIRVVDVWIVLFMGWVSGVWFFWV